ncbi:unnamed protein product [Trichobilharzia regenti]|nr:unnamed protein product [Trichobilharzia regenti]
MSTSQTAPCQRVPSRLSKLQRKLLSLTQEAESQKKAKQQLEEELRSLESAYFQPNVHNEKKRSDLLSECKLKLEEYDKHIAQNEKLRAFIELWKAKCGDNFRLDENEEAQRSVTKLTPAESEGQGLELHKELKPNGTSCDGQLNLSIDLDAQIQGSNALDASRLRMSALDTSVMPALCRKESKSFLGELFSLIDLVSVIEKWGLSCHV